MCMAADDQIALHCVVQTDPVGTMGHQNPVVPGMEHLIDCSCGAVFFLPPAVIAAQFDDCAAYNHRLRPIAQYMHAAHLQLLLQLFFIAAFQFMIAGGIEKRQILQFLNHLQHPVIPAVIVVKEIARKQYQIRFRTAKTLYIAGGQCLAVQVRQYSQTDPVRQLLRLYAVFCHLCPPGKPGQHGQSPADQKYL